jgi:hypothetical protein
MLMLAVGLVSLLLGRSFLFPSLGPSAYLQAENPAHPSTRFINTVAGHLIGLLAGLVVGVLIVAVLGELVRWLRLGSIATRAAVEAKVPGNSGR